MKKNNLQKWIFVVFLITISLLYNCTETEIIPQNEYQEENDAVKIFKKKVATYKNKNKLKSSKLLGEPLWNLTQIKKGPKGKYYNVPLQREVNINSFVKYYIDDSNNIIEDEMINFEAIQESKGVDKYFNSLFFYDLHKQGYKISDPLYSYAKQMQRGMQSIKTSELPSFAKQSASLKGPFQIGVRYTIAFEETISLVLNSNCDPIDDISTAWVERELNDYAYYSASADGVPKIVLESVRVFDDGMTLNIYCGEKDPSWYEQVIDETISYTEHIIRNKVNSHCSVLSSSVYFNYFYYMNPTGYGCENTPFTNDPDFSHAGGGTDFDSEPYIVVDPGPDNIINNLTGKALCTYEQLKELNLFKATIAKFENNKDMYLQINSGGVCNNSGDDGCTDGDYVDKGLVIINIVNEGYGSLDLAALILHEGIHAEIFKYVYEYDNGIDPNNRKNLLAQYFKYKNAEGKYNSSVAQHQHMADNFVKSIAQAIRKLDGFKHPVESYLGFGWSGLQKYGWDGYYDNGVLVTLPIVNLFDTEVKYIIDNSNFNKNCN